MDENKIQIQIDEINHKLDTLLEYVNQQRLKSIAVDDLISDISIVGKDVYDTAVIELDNHGIEIDPDDLKLLFVRLVKNIKNFRQMFEMIENISDLSKDALPIINEVILDFTGKLYDFEKKGYFEFFREMAKVIDKAITTISPEDIRKISDNMPLIIDTIKSITQPEVLDSINKAVKVYGKADINQVPEYSLWKVYKEMKTPEMKRSMGFVFTIIKNLAEKSK